MIEAEALSLYDHVINQIPGILHTIISYHKIEFHAAQNTEAEYLISIKIHHNTPYMNHTYSAAASINGSDFTSNQSAILESAII